LRFKTSFPEEIISSTLMSSENTTCLTATRSNQLLISY